MPSYTNTASLYSVTNAPVLKEKEAKKILELHKNIVENKENYFLLSSNISHAYNMPMSLLRILGTNVISLKALNVCELLLIYATNSSAIYRQTKDSIKHFVIPADFFNLEDFSLSQSEQEILDSLKELKSIGLIDDVKFSDNNFIIHTNVIIKSIKQHSYKQCLHYYRNLDLRQQDYAYTFINLMHYILNMLFKKIKLMLIYSIAFIGL